MSSCLEMLVYDTREPAHIKKLLEALPDTREDALPCGDYVVEVDNKPVVIFERKTYADLVESLNDGRFVQQRTRLLETGARVVYILEGKPQITRRVCGAIENLATVHMCGIIPTAGPANTVETLVNVNTKMTRVQPVADTSAGLLAPQGRAAQRRAIETREGAWTCLLAQIRGVSLATARAVAAQFEHAGALAAPESVQALARVRATPASRLLGPVLAQRIRASLGYR